MANRDARLQLAQRSLQGWTDCEEREHEFVMLDRKLSFSMGDGGLP